MEITPASGSITTNVSTWNTSGNYSKEWTESGSGSMSVAHALGNLKANTHYDVKIDGSLSPDAVSGANCTNSVCLSDSNGEIAFTYAGSYSIHTFTVTEADVNAPTVANASPQGVNYPAGTDSVTMSLDTSENATCKYSTETGQSYSDMPNTFSTTGGLSHSTTVADLQNGASYHYYVKCRDAAGNANSQDQEISFSVSSSEYIPVLAIGKSKTYDLSPDISVAVDSKYLVFRGKLDNLQNGRVEIYQDGELKETDRINKRNRWRIRIKEKSRNATYTYQFKYYDSSENLIETSREYTVMVDREKPRFSYLPKRVSASPGDIITWTATDNDQIKYYRISFRGRKYNTADNFFVLPSSLKKGVSKLTVRVYDRAENRAMRITRIRVR